MSPKSISLISTFVNAGLAILKLFIGLATHSVALMADALHSGLDIVSSFVAFLGIKTSVKPADPKHPYGHERYESLASFIVVLLLFITSAWILFEAIKNIIAKEASAQFSIWGIIIIAATIVINEVMARFKFSIGNKHSSLVLVADAEHSRADAISSVAVLVGLFAIKFYPLADSILAILVALYIFYEAIRLSRDSIDSLVDTANPEIEKKIKSILVKEKFEFSEIKTRRIGASNFAEISLLCDPKIQMDKATALVKNLEEKLLNSIPELKQVSLIVKSHEFTEKVIRPAFGRHFHFRRGFERIGPKKPNLSKEKETKRIVVPLHAGEIAPEFGASEYLVVDIDNQGKLLQKNTVKNPYFEASGPAHGTKCVKSLSADKVIAKHIGENAKTNLKAQNIDIEIIDANKKLKDLKFN